MYSDELAPFLDALKLKCPGDQAEALANACLENDGCYEADHQGGKISLFKVLGQGRSLVEVCENWIKAAEHRVQIHAEVNRSENLLRGPDGSPDELLVACEYITANSGDPASRLAAEEVLKQVNKQEIA
ncbi:hypothetical protein [Thalassobius sp. I31.1]|uniref:hypothetical protein n=1 Tax=Thalassobius sp. I31.1 TaxID=2109912 RepID=UPI000D1C06C5|nr:hypothetical protein [Thalassobius sp. I31.1]